MNAALYIRLPARVCVHTSRPCRGYARFLPRPRDLMTSSDFEVWFPPRLALVDEWRFDSRQPESNRQP